MNKSSERHDSAKATTGTTTTKTTTVTNVTEVSRICWLRKISEVSVNTSQTLKVTYPGFEAQRLVYLPRAIVHTSHK